MPTYLRKVDNRRWDWVSTTFPWLAGAFPAAPLGDLKTDIRCGLSVWQLQSDSSNLYRIVAAQAAGLLHLEKFDYILFDSTLPGTVQIDMRQTPGSSKDRDANKAWHWDLIELTSTKLVGFAQQLKGHGQIGGRVDEDEVAIQITQSVNEGHIKKEHLEESLRKQVFGN